ncbi:hypothetical protein SAMN05660745_02512 [Corynebacterium glucuronolyticum]|nr:hypothetical protein CGLUCO_03825 [Corynebacterium glucuronolyticum DSM 44120]SMB81908.1 hypothetical protein SAMN05660745_02512 [Corynebacterium glucuronolyticum]
MVIVKDDSQPEELASAHKSAADNSSSSGLMGRIDEILDRVTTGDDPFVATRRYKESRTW